jgi:hypothetical protein
MHDHIPLALEARNGRMVDTLEAGQLLTDETQYGRSVALFDQLLTVAAGDLGKNQLRDRFVKKDDSRNGKPIM